MRKVFKEIFSRYIEEREEVNSGGGGDDEKEAPPQRSSTSYGPKKTTGRSAGELNMQSPPPGTKNIPALPSASHPEVFNNHHPNGALHPGGFGHGAHHNHRGGRGAGGHKPRAAKAAKAGKPKAARRRKK